MYAGWAMVLIAFIIIVWRIVRFTPKTAQETRVAQTGRICGSTLTRAQKGVRRRKTKAQKAARRKNRS